MNLKINQLIPLVLLITLCSFSNPEQISDHMKAITKIGEQMSDPILHQNDRMPLLEKFNTHRDALVELEKRTFELKYLEKGSVRFAEFNKEIFNRFNQDPIFPIREYEWGKTKSSSIQTLTVWDTPVRMKKWDSFIKEFDVPETN